MLEYVSLNEINGDWIPHTKDVILYSIERERGVQREREREHHTGNDWSEFDHAFCGEGCIYFSCVEDLCVCRG